MGQILSLRRWHRFEFEMGGGRLACEVKQLNALEAGPIKAAMARASSALADEMVELQRLREGIPDEPPEPEGKPPDPPADASPEETAAHDAAVEAWLRASPAYLEAMRERSRLAAKAVERSREVAAGAMLPEAIVRDIYGRYVRNVEGLEVDGEAKTGGLDLLEVTDEHGMSAVVGKLRALFELSPREGKASASPSMSSPEGVTGAGDSGAKSTDAGAGPAS